MQPPLSLVVFTVLPLREGYDRLFRKLAAHPDLDLRAIVVDAYEPPRPSRLGRLARALARDGAPRLWYKIGRTLAAWVRSAVQGLYEISHPPRSPGISFERLAGETGVRVLFTPDIHSPETLDAVRGLAPDLGVLCGGRILSPGLLSLPRRGTINIHRHKVPDYRGGGPPGYWELLDGAPELGLTVHYATERVDAGNVLAEAAVPIEAFDTLESLRIKAEVLGNELYFETLLRLAREEDPGRPQAPAPGPARRAPGPVAEHRLEGMRRKKLSRMPRFRRPRAHWTRTVTGLVKYLAALPFLLTRRRRLRRAGSAPIVVLYYHTVGNDGESPQALPLEVFARQVRFLMRHFEILSLEEAAHRLASGANATPAAVLTFDDGYAADLGTSIPFLRYYGIPATFFLSAGHVETGAPFAHDRALKRPPRPFRVAEAASLVRMGFAVGSHGLFHERFAGLSEKEMERVLRASRERLAEWTGAAPRAFAFPGGLWERDLDRKALRKAAEHYPLACVAWGGYNHPLRSTSPAARAPGNGSLRGRVIFRYPAPDNVLELAWLMDGFTRLREVLRGNAWGMKDAGEWEEP
ncbi:MAG: polysaccharide deacetylase family protein [Planctomycetota bacterium]